MSTLPSAFMFFFILAVNSQNYVGPITINEDGTNVTRYVMADNPSGVEIMNNSTIETQHGYGYSIAAKQSDTFQPYIWTEYKLINKTISFTTDLSEIGCSCNANIYLVTMPGYNSSGQPGTYPHIPPIILTTNLMTYN